MQRSTIMHNSIAFIILKRTVIQLHFILHAVVDISVCYIRICTRDRLIYDENLCRHICEPPGTLQRYEVILSCLLPADRHSVCQTNGNFSGIGDHIYSCHMCSVECIPICEAWWLHCNQSQCYMRVTVVVYVIKNLIIDSKCVEVPTWGLAHWIKFWKIRA